MPDPTPMNREDVEELAKLLDEAGLDPWPDEWHREAANKAAAALRQLAAELSALREERDRLIGKK